uniref:CCHC-type domain-containing protein n=1 Tax=Gouania willdenowi TaxID=441366 RepID=A0A8C5DBT5_GOUWI
MNSASQKESPMERLDRLEKCMEQHQAQLQSATSDVRQAAAANDQTIATLSVQIQQLAVTVTQLVTAVGPNPAPAPPPADLAPPLPVSEPRVGTPERYGGDPEGCNPFLTNCSILFALQPHTFSTERTKVAFAINHRTERARLWGTAEWERQTPACSSFQAFADELCKVFGETSIGPDAGGGLLGIRQGARTVSDYSIEFRIRALQSQWNAAAQTDAYLLGLNDYIKDELVSHDPPSSLDKLIELATRLDRRIQARQQEKRHRIPERLPVPRPRPPVDVNHFPAPHEGGPEPMHVGRTSLSPEEREHCRQRNLCLYCGKPGHYVFRCPVKGALNPVTLSPVPKWFSGRRRWRRTLRLGTTTTQQRQATPLAPPPRGNTGSWPSTLKQRK